MITIDSALVGLTCFFACFSIGLVLLSLVFDD
jgi:hypothetical protein